MIENCSSTLSEVLSYAERGAAPPEHLQSHIAECSECRRVLAALRELEVDLEDAGTEPDPALLHRASAECEKVAARTDFRRQLLKLFVSFLLVAVVAALIFLGVAEPQARPMVGIIFLVAAPLFVITAVLLALYRSINAPGQRLYKRLGPGRQVSGVALGLAEALKVPVWLPRVLFVLLTFFDGIGILIYIVLALMMKVHPEDRQYLLRFRVARWWRTVGNG